MTARDPYEAARRAIYAAQPAGATLDLEGESAVETVIRIYKAGKTKRRRRDWKAQKADQRAAAVAAVPLPYAALAGREKLTRSHVIAEARSRLMSLRHASAAGGSQFLVEQRGRETTVVEAWKTLQLLRIATKDEANPREVGENCAALSAVANAGTRRRKADRYLKTAERLEAEGVWKPFSLLNA